MAEFKIHGSMKVKTLKEKFFNEYGGVLRVYAGKSLAKDEDTLASIRADKAKGGDLICRSNRTVGRFEQEMQEIFGIKVQVATKDNFVLVLDGITLSKISEIPVYATKEKMKEFLPSRKIKENGGADVVVEQFENDSRIENDDYEDENLVKNESTESLNRKLIEKLEEYCQKTGEESFSFGENEETVMKDCEVDDSEELFEYGYEYSKNTNLYYSEDPQTFVTCGMSWSKEGVILTRSELYIICEIKLAEISRKKEVLVTHYFTDDGDGVDEVFEKDGGALFRADSYVPNTLSQAQVMVEFIQQKIDELAK